MGSEGALAEALDQSPSQTLPHLQSSFALMVTLVIWKTLKNRWPQALCLASSCCSVSSGRTPLQLCDLRQFSPGLTDLGLQFGASAGTYWRRYCLVLEEAIQGLSRFQSSRSSHPASSVDPAPAIFALVEVACLPLAPLFFRCRRSRRSTSQGRRWPAWADQTLSFRLEEGSVAAVPHQSQKKRPCHSCGR